MLFDVKAALAEILNAVPVTAMSVTAIPANAAIVGDRTGAESQQSRQSQSQPSENKNAARGQHTLPMGASPHPRPDWEAVQAQSLSTSAPAQSSGAVAIHLARGKTGLPTHPATCAVCGISDWKVCMRDAKGRAMHVGCWRGGEVER